MIKITTLNVAYAYLSQWKKMTDDEKDKFLKSSTHYTLYAYLQLNPNHLKDDEIFDFERTLYKRARQQKIEITETKNKGESKYGYPYQFIENIYKEYKGVK